MGKIEELKSEQRQLAARIKDIELAISEYETWECRVASLLSGNNDASAAMPLTNLALAQSEPSALTSTSDIPPTSMREFVAAVDAVLNETEVPLDRNAFLAEIEKRGVIVGGADPRNTLSTRLSRLPYVTNIRSYGFWKKDRPFPKAGYQPDSGSRTGETLPTFPPKESSLAP